MLKNLPKIIAIVGPTASGKTEVGIKLAKKYKGEVISADSRQVYKEMDIATGRPSGIWRKGVLLVHGVPHYLMDVINPDEEFSVAEFKARAEKIIKDILRRGKLPIIVGGAGLYIWSVVDNLNIFKVAINKKIRAELESKELTELAKELKKIDAVLAKKIDLKNKRRVVRALEAALVSKTSSVKQQRMQKPNFEVLQIGLNWPRAELNNRIDLRIDGQFKDGLAEEAKKLLKKYPISLPSMSGIGYKEIAAYLAGETTLAEAIKIIKNRTHQYAKRQITWFKRDKRIEWVERSSFIEVEEKIRRRLD